MPAIFIHGEEDDFVAPKHSLSLYEKYGDKRKEIVLVAGDHNAPRPMDALIIFPYFCIVIYILKI